MQNLKTSLSIVHEKEKVNGKKTQKVEIHYNFGIGQLLDLDILKVMKKASNCTNQADVVAS